MAMMARNRTAGTPSRTGLRRLDEITAAVVYLASAEAERASGAVLDLNGTSYLR
jgi:hypothetical protein